MAGLLFRQILSLALIMACGYALVRLKVLEAKESRALSVISIYLIMPCVIVNAFQIDLTDEIRNGFLLAVAASVAIHALLLAFSVLLKRLFGLDAVERCSIVYSNAGNLVIPLVTAVLGSEWVIYASAYICVQQVFIWTHCQSALRGERGVNWKKLATNINMISILIGLVMLFAHIRVPEVLASAMRSLSGTIGPICMIMMGMLLASTNLKAFLRSGRFYLTLLCRLVVMPLAVLALLRLTGAHALVPEGKTILYVTFMATITPPANTVAQLAQLYGRDAERAGALNAAGMLLCVLTMPLLTQLYMLWG